jgi:uncharacterized lipoprotein YddW (UPF0748 family)
MREMRALCSHQFEAILLGDFDPQNIGRMVEDVAAANFNAIQLCVRNPGVLFYPSERGPVHPYCRTYDLAGEVIRQSHDAGLEVHSYCPIFTEGGWAGNEYQRDLNGGMFAQHPEWRVICYSDGELAPSCFACPSSEEYLNYIAGIVEEQSARYEFDAIILDFIRFNYRCFCRNCRQGFRALFGEELVPSPGATVDEAEVEYRCSMVERAVKRLAGIVRGHGIKVGAYTFPGARTARVKVFQDWLLFSKYLDFVLPMYYDSHSLPELSVLVPRHRQLVACPVIPGVIAIPEPAVHVGRGDAAFICAFLSIVREAGCEGFFIFNYETLFRRPPGESLGKIIRPPEPQGTLELVKSRFLREKAQPFFRHRGEP